MATMSETLPFASSPDIPADIFLPYITLSRSPPSFNTDSPLSKDSSLSHSARTVPGTGSQMAIDSPPKTQADQSSSPPRKRRKGGKIFSGCSTCRQRKMKCDQRRPVCSNCARSRLYVCRGFEDDSISKESSRTPRTEAQSRPRPRDSAYHETKPLWDSTLQSNPQIFAADLNNFSPFFFQDNTSLRLDAQILAPTLQPPQPQSSRPIFSTQLEAPLPPSDIPAFIDDISFWDQLLDSNDTTHQDSQQVRDLIHLPPLSRVSSPSSSLHPSLSIPTTFPAPYSELLYHYRTLVSQQMMPTCSPSQNPWLQLYLPLALQEPRTEPKQMLLHAILSVSAFSRAALASSEGEKYRLQGVRHGEEAVRRLREAIDGNGDRMDGDEKGKGKGKQQQKGEIDPVDKQALLAAALTISTIDVWSGANKGNGYIYLRMAKEVIQLTGGISWWLSAAPPTMTIFQIFRCYNIIASTTSWPSPQDQIRDQDRFLLEEDDNGELNGDSPTIAKSEDDPNSSCSPDPQSALLSADNQNHIQEPIHDQVIPSFPSTLDIQHPNNTPYTLDISFGIAIKTLWCLNKTVSLSTLHSTFTPGKTWSPSQLLEIQELQNELDFPLRNPEAFRASIASSNSSSGVAGGGGGGIGPGISQMVTDEIKENHVWAFHYSVILFFRRALAHTLPSSILSKAQQTAEYIPSQTLISHTLTHLENIDTLTPSLPISNTLWPAFIASSESIHTPLRHRCLAWFIRARRHGIGNIEEAKKLVMEVWRRVDRERYVVGEREGEEGLRGELCAEVDWRVVMREGGTWVMLT
ncbi:hypothetical protein ONS96_008662 [Cadophora gregata f. sp. sojae]|nr:hypothetical protein ONS96_008662 [Cadophora gregata f. sp. sojae]